MAIGSVDIEPSPAGMSLRIAGTWEFDNLVQVVSGLSFNVLLVRQDNFVRFLYPGQAFSGKLDGLSAKIDAGINGDEIVAVEAAGSTDSTARFISLEAQRMKLSSPVPAGEGPISILAYLVLDGDYVGPVISNTITRPLELGPTVIGSEPTQITPPPTVPVSPLGQESAR
jgi:hypothetical protein